MRAKPTAIIALTELVKMGASRGSVALNTHQFAKTLDISQQGASRRLLDLEKMGLIERRVSRRGQMVKLTGAALEILRQHYMDLKPVFEPGDGEKVFLEGTLFTGLGEGRYYMSLDGYRKAFRDKLGFDPFPGTLNLRLNSPHDMEARRQLDGRKHILIPTFSDGARTYSSVKLLRCKVNDSEDGAVLLIERTHYGADVLEVVAPIELRRRFRLKDGDRVRVQVFT